jgi:hypothetical protein
LRLSDDKITHLTHVLLKGLIERKVVTPMADEGTIRREIRRIIMNVLMEAEEIDAVVRKKLESYSKKIYEGSTEWDVLYNKFFTEESAKRGFVI